MPFNSSGLRSLGVNAVNPPDTIFRSWEPTQNDYIMHDVGKFWYVDYGTTPATYSLWYLASKADMVATWIKLYPQGTGGGGNLRSDDGEISVPDGLGAINVSGGQPYVIGSDAWLDDPVYSNIFTAANPIDNTLEIVLKRSIMQPKGTADGLRGLYGIDGDDFMHGYGTGNTMLGSDAGNRTLDVLGAINNTCIGYNTLQSINTANSCTGLGFNVFSHVIGSGYLIGIGQNAGDNYVLNESSNIVIGNPGILSENNVIRVGQMPLPDPLVAPGNGEQNQVFLAGVWNSPAVPVANTGLVIVDDAGQLYVDDLAPNSVIMTNAGGNPIAVKGPKKTVLTGRGLGAGDPAPTFLELRSANGTVGITVTPAGPNIDCINLEVLPAAGGVAQLTTDTGIVLPLLANIDVLGGELINTDNLVANTVTVNLDRSANNPLLTCEIIAGNGAANPSAYKEIYSSDGSIDLDFTTDPTKIDVKYLGAPLPGGITKLNGDVGPSALPNAGEIDILGSHNINTISSNPFPGTPGVVQVFLNDNVDITGWLHAVGEIQATGVGSSLITDHGHVRLPDTDVGGFGGQIQFVNALGNNVRWISNYGTYNTFVGQNSGSLALNPASATNCTFIGKDVGMSHLTGESNTAVGSSAFDVNVSGAQCTILGVSAFGRDLGSSYSTCLGWHAGYNAVAANNNSCLYIDNVGVAGESNCIRIGQEGLVAHHQDKCYIAGIYPAVAGPAPRMVVCGSDGKLSTQAIPGGGGGILQLTADNGGHAIPDGVGNIDIEGNTNITTTATLPNGHLLRVALNEFIQWNATDPTHGFINLGINNFMHNFSTVGEAGLNTFLGSRAGQINALQTGRSLTGIGAASLAKNTSGYRNTCLGTGSGKNITSANDVIAIGVDAGSSYTVPANNYNIVIGHAGEAVDLRTTRIGYNTQWVNGVRTVDGTRNAYMYGIYEATTGPSAVPVYVDQAGHLGTTGGVAFLFMQNSSLVNVTGNGTIYGFGHGTPLVPGGGLVKEYDITNSVTLGGGGALAEFTVPFTGRYMLGGTITYTIPAAAPRGYSPFVIATSSGNYTFATYLPSGIVGVTQYVSETVQVPVQLTAGDTVHWYCQVSGVGADTIGIKNELVVGVWPTPPGRSNATFFYGYRI